MLCRVALWILCFRVSLLIKVGRWYFCGSSGFSRKNILTPTAITRSVQKRGKPKKGFPHRQYIFRLQMWIRTEIWRKPYVLQLCFFVNLPWLPMMQLRAWFRLQPPAGVNWYIASKTVSYEETDNVQGQIPEHIFVPKGGYCVYYPSNLFRNSRSFENWGIFSDIPQF